MTFAARVRRDPLRSYFALVFGISWGGILIVMGSTDFNLIDLRPLDTGLVFVSMLLGPSVAGLAMTAMLDGRQGLRHLVSRAARCRVGRFCRDSGERVKAPPDRSASEGQRVELVSSRRGSVFDEIELPLLEHVHGFDARDDGASAAK